MPRNKKSRIRTPPVTAVLNAAELSSGFLAFPSGECQHKRLQALRPRLTPGLPKFSVLRGCSRLLVLSYTVRDAKGVIRWRGADFSAWPPGPCTGIILPNLALSMQMEMLQIIGSWDNTTFFIDEFLGNIGQILTVRCDRVFFFQQTNTRSLAGCFNLIFRDHFSCFVARNSFHLTWYIRDQPL